MDDRLELDYYYGRESLQFSFLIVPKVLIRPPYSKLIKAELALLYSDMLERMELSIKNGWIDNKGRPYIIYTNSDVCELMGCERDKARDLLQKLDVKTGVGLIERVPREKGRPEIIYLKNFISIDKEGVVGNSDPLKSQSLDTSGLAEEGSRKNRLLPVGNPDPNNKELNNTEDYINPSTPISLSEKRAEKMEAYRQIIRENIEYEGFMQQHTSPAERELFHYLYEILCDIVCSEGDFIRIKGEKKPYEVVKKKFLDIGLLEMEYAIQHLSENTSYVRKSREYAIVTLYDASLSAGLSMTQKVRYDMAHPEVSDRRNFG